MEKKLVCNASTTIHLAKLSIIETVVSQFESYMISEKVYEESVMKAKPKYGDAYVTEGLVKKGMIIVKAVKNQVLVKKLTEDFNVGEGEAETVALFLQEKASILATNDGRAIMACEIMGIPYTTSVSLIAYFAQKKPLSRQKALEALDALEKECWINKSIVLEAKNKVRGIRLE